MIRFCTLVIMAFALATAQSAAAPPAVVVRDPAQYAQVFADSMAVSGVRPIREAFTTLMAPATMSAEAEAGLLAYERAITRLPAQVSRVIEDLVLGDVLRTIYLYHYYGDNTWVFTRLDFARVSEDEWALTRVAFADRWANVVLATTPAFAPRRRGRRAASRRLRGTGEPRRRGGV